MNRISQGHLNYRKVGKDCSSEISVLYIQPTCKVSVLASGIHIRRIPGGGNRPIKRSSMTGLGLLGGL